MTFYGQLLPINEVKDTDGFPPPVPGVTMTKWGSITYQTAANTALFFLPNNAEIVGWMINVTTAFNASTTNTLDIGVSGAQQQFGSAIALGTAAGQILNGFIASQMFTKLAGQTVVTVRYNQTGAAATAGAAQVNVDYIIR